MSTEQLPDGLQLAVALLGGDRAAFVESQVHPVDGLSSADADIACAYTAAIDAIRAEHAQRLTLQHHAADMAQRAADLERLNSIHHAAWLAYQPLGDYMQALSTAGELPTGTLGRHLGDVAIERMQAQEARIAELEVERDEWRRIASAYSPTKELAESLKKSKASGAAVRNERDALRARLAEIEVRAVPCAAGWKLVTLEPTEGMIEAGKDVKRRRLLAAVKELSADKPYDTMAQAIAVHEEWAAMVAAAIAEARREGAEHMKAKCIALKDDALFVFGEPRPPEVGDVIEWYSGSIHALPLSTGGRQAVLLTDDQIATATRHLYACQIAAVLGAADDIETARAIEAAVLAANGLEVRR